MFSLKNYVVIFTIYCIQLSNFFLIFLTWHISRDIFFQRTPPIPNYLYYMDNLFKKGFSLVNYDMFRRLKVVVGTSIYPINLLNHRGYFVLRKDKISHDNKLFHNNKFL